MNRTITIEIHPTPEELAEIFCDMVSADQARFFNTIHEISSKWSAPFCFQLQAITDDKELSDNGRYIMKEIGEYSSKSV